MVDSREDVCEHDLCLAVVAEAMHESGSVYESTIFSGWWLRVRGRIVGQ